MPDERTMGLRTPDGRQPLVVVIDGNPATSSIAAMLLEQFDCRALLAHSGEAALKVLKSDPAVDLVLLDFTLGDMDPMVAAQLIRALGPNGAVPIIALATTASATSGPRGHAVGFARTVTKPYSPRELYTAIDYSLGRVAEGAASH
jgi:CheY-like chemotaxis protein